MKLTLYPLEGSVSKGFTPSVRPEGPLPAPICVAGCFCESMSQLKHFRKAFPDHLSRSGVSPQPSTSVPVFIYLSLFFFFSWGRFFFYSSRKKSTQKHTKETQKNTVKVPQTRNSSRLFSFFFFCSTIFPITFFLLIFNWRTIALQYCVGFYHISTWICQSYTYVPSLLNLSPYSSLLSKILICLHGTHNVCVLHHPQIRMSAQSQKVYLSCSPLSSQCLVPGKHSTSPECPSDSQKDSVILRRYWSCLPWFQGLPNAPACRSLCREPES